MTRRIGWWLLLATCALYAGFAAWQAAAEALSFAGLVDEAKARAVPVAFVLHAAAGAVCLVTGAVQFNHRIRRRHPGAHGAVGRVYVWSAWVSSATALISAAFFDVPLAARIVFAAAAVMWFATTSVARARILSRRVADHRDWMVRSFSLAMFFVVFEFWVSALALSPLNRDIAYPLGVLLAWLGNTAVAEAVIRQTRPSRGQPLSLAAADPRPVSAKADIPPTAERAASSAAGHVSLQEDDRSAGGVRPHTSPTHS